MQRSHPPAFKGQAGHRLAYPRDYIPCSAQIRGRQSTEANRLGKSPTPAKSLPGPLPACVWSVRSGSDHATARAVSGGAHLCPLPERRYLEARIWCGAVCCASVVSVSTRRETWQPWSICVGRRYSYFCCTLLAQNVLTLVTKTTLSRTGSTTLHVCVTVSRASTGYRG